MKPQVQLHQHGQFAFRRFIACTNTARRVEQCLICIPCDSEQQCLLCTYVVIQPCNGQASFCGKFAGTGRLKSFLTKQTQRCRPYSLLGFIQWLLLVRWYLHHDVGVPSSVERVSSPSFWVREERRTACHFCPIIANPSPACLSSSPWLSHAKGL